MRRFALAALAVAACAPTDAELRAAPPAMAFTSQKPVDAVVACLIPSLGQQYSGAYGRKDRFIAEVRAPGRDYDVVPAGQAIDGKYPFAVNVKANSGRTAVSMYEPTGFSIAGYMRDGVAAGIQPCL